MKKPPEYSIFSTALQEEIIKKLKFFHEPGSKIPNPLLTMTLDTNSRTMLLSNILTPDKVQNIIGRLIKKRKNSSDPIFLVHYKQQKQNLSPIIECESCELSETQVFALINTNYTV